MLEIVIVASDPSAGLRASGGILGKYDILKNSEFLTNK